MGLIFFLFATNLLDFFDYKQQIALGVSVGVGILIRFSTYKTRAPSDNVYVVF